MQIHHVRPTHKRKTRKRVGRGGKRGTYSGRGVKGQRARAGSSIRPALRDLIKKIPKLRGVGYHHSISSFRAIVNVTDLETHFSSGERVTPAILMDKGLLKQKKGRLPAVKILGSGVLTKKLFVSDCAVSGGARKKIEEAGGSVRALSEKPSSKNEG